MRLAFCNATRRWGGVKTWTVEFAAALKARGHALFLYGRDPAFIERARAAGLEAGLVNFGCDFNPLTTARFWREFRQKGIEAVLVNVGKDLSTAGLAARLAGLPLVQRIGLPGDIRNSPQAAATARLLKPHYLCPCYYIRDGMAAQLPFVTAANSAVVYSAKTALPEPPVTLNRPLRLLSSSQVNANKGHAELAHTLAALMREGCDFHWHIAGVGDCLAHLEALCQSLGLGARVTFHGFVQDMPGLLKTCDVFVLSSYIEGLPNTLLEALAHGLIPVVRAVGGVRECMPPQLEACIAPFGPGQATDWAALEPGQLPLYAPLQRVLTASPVQAEAWKRLAWEHCRTHFSLETQAGLLERYFEERIQSLGPRTGT